LTLLIHTSHNFIAMSPTTVSPHFDQNHITSHAYVPTMDAYLNDPFSVEYDETKIATETIKWTLGATGAMKHEIVLPILTKFELRNIVVHCLTVMHKLDAHAGNHPANPFTLYMDVYPLTLLLPHVAMWDTVLVDHPLATQDKAGFQQAIRHFIAVHTTDEDCHELLDYICSVAKLCKWMCKLTIFIYKNLITK
jgi:hypothetical protein